MRAFLAALTLTATSAFAGDITPRDGWVVIKTPKKHAALVNDLKAAVSANNMGIVTQASPTAAARKRGIAIPENRVLGVFNNDYAVQILALSTAAIIEAPIRFYVTEEKSGTATLSYKTPSLVFAPYADEGGDALVALVARLDATFDTIARQASQ